MDSRHSKVVVCEIVFMPIVLSITVLLVLVLNVVHSSEIVQLKKTRSDAWFFFSFVS